ncbi:MAG: cytochrome c oxidase subunit [Actinomycetota bacterium]|jgi:cytochrome c oxidase subunit 2|nr:cytochrome c oxidase subunit [Actinomycetota bacterium]
MRRPSNTRSRRFYVGATLFALVLLFAGCANNGPQDFLNYQAGSNAEKADNLWDVTILIAAVIFVVVEGLLVFALVRFRHKPGREAAQFHGNTKLEIVLTLVPALILIGLLIPSIKTIFDIAHKPEGALEITVTARQFWWQYDYDDFDFATANELHIPVGQPVHLTLKGADVIHSYWIPRLSGTQDVVPGHNNELNFTALEPGRYMGQCKEFCGLSHANMRLIVFAHPPAEFQTWVSEQQKPAAPPSADVAEGQKLFLEGACINCHAIQGTDAAATTAPDLTHLASRETFGGATFELNEANLAEWLADPPAMKPGSLMPDYGLSQDEITKLVDYLMSLD